MTHEQVKRILDMPNGTEKLMENAPAAFDAAWELFTEGDATALAFLCRCAKRKEYASRIREKLGMSREILSAALTAEQPKLRKNAARLCGTLGDAEYASALINALRQEQARFVRPSQLLALGALGSVEAEDALRAYIVEPPADESEQKHFHEESQALVTALKSFTVTERHEFTGLKAPVDILLRSPDLLSDALAYELGLMHITPGRVFSGGVLVNTADLPALYGARSFFEAMIVLARGVASTPKAITIAVKQKLTDILAASHGGMPPFAYRIELRGDFERGTFARELASLMDGDALVNSPGDYEAELRIEQRKSGADIYLKLYTYKDTRFDYRVGALSASMQPSTAAAVLRHARDYLHDNARVLDPCCGSGTFLFERERYTQKPVAGLTGVDIAHAAIEIARNNAAAAESRAKFIVNDCLRFTANRPYDEVIANLPFGNRVGDHSTNIKLYAGILDRLGEWLVPGGTAVLYTMEFTLLKRLIRERNALRLVTEARTGAGGLTPGIFIIKMQG